MYVCHLVLLSFSYDGTCLNSIYVYNSVLSFCSTDLERQLGMLGVVKTKLTSKKSAASKQQEPRFEISLKNGGRSYRLGSSESDDSCSDD